MRVRTGDAQNGHQSHTVISVTISVLEPSLSVLAFRQWHRNHQNTAHARWGGCLGFEARDNPQKDLRFDAV